MCNVSRMYALSHDLARHRVLYSRPLPTLPDILLIDVPPRFAHPSLPLGRYYPIIVETDEELEEVERFLVSRRAAPVQPDLLDHRPSNLAVTRITFSAYAPPVPGWPHVLLCSWPTAYVALASDPELFARGAYTSEVFDTAEQLAAASARLLEVLGDSSNVAVTMIGADDRPVGRA